MSIPVHVNKDNLDWSPRTINMGSPQDLSNLLPVPSLKKVKEKKRYAIMAGSFNPFHVGHLDVALQAAAIFDEVEIVQGWNRDKPRPRHGIMMVKSLENMGFKRGVCNGLLTTYIQKNYAGCDVTLVRGLRNSLDLQAEINLSRFYQDLMPELKIVYIICDRKFEHISSSAIRTLSEFQEDKKYIVP